jgi:methyl-accepting chemotaxis protein WspA
MDLSASKTPSWSTRLFALLTLLQKYYLINLIFFIPLFILGWNSWQHFEREQKSLDLKLKGYEYQQPLRKLFEEMMSLQLHAHQIDLNSPTQLQQQQAAVDQNFKQLNAFDSTLYSSLFIQEGNFEEKQMAYLNPHQLEILWNQWLNASDTQTQQNFYEQFMQNIQLLLIYTGDTSSLSLDSDLSSYYLSQQMIIQIPKIQKLISEILLLMYPLDQLPSSPDIILKLLYTKYLQLQELVRLMRNQLAILSLDKNLDHWSVLQVSYETYTDSLDALVSQLKKPELFENKNFLDELSSQGTDVLESGFRYWNELSQAINQNLVFQKAQVQKNHFLTLALTTTFYLVGALLGYLLIRSIIQALSRISIMSQKLAKGEIFAYLPVESSDEVSKVNQQMNQMADAFQETMEKSQNLFQAITCLAEGDFSIRIQKEEKSFEISPVGQAFNQMAQSFETMIQRLHQLGSKLTTSTSQLTLATKQQATVIQKQQQTTLEISSASNEISETSKSLAHTVNEVTSVADHTSTLASTGQANLIYMEQIMQSIVNASNHITSKLDILNQKASNINHVVTTITKVADQTNLLSLNAAIEAERAGEFGRGFMIIAQEIRRLADQTAIATLNIEKMVQEITQAIADSVTGIDEFSHQIQNGVNEINQVKNQLIEIIHEVKGLTDRFSAVNLITQSQFTGAEQISDSISELGKTIQYTRESLTHVTDTLRDLDEEIKNFNTSLPRTISLNL